MTILLRDSRRYIEVKAARQSGRRLSFFVTANEVRKSRTLPDYHFYLVLRADSKKPAVYMVRAVDAPAAALVPVTDQAMLERTD